MKLSFALAFALVFAVVDPLNAVPDVTVKDSHVPNEQYEVDAVKFYLESLAKYPNDTTNRAKNFADLFQAKHSVEGGWRVAEGCSSMYTPGRGGDYNHVSLNVIDGETKTVVKIFV
ncbi:hypothetical protein JTB14_002494 [Gonioctena quinquepunctata]|nr:hypothetical protein JTB14_002494 [Gonioctena quinquepunctata]